MNYQLLLTTITGTPYPEVPARWVNRMDAYLKTRLTPRDYDTLSRWSEGETLKSIARTNGICGSRAGQIRNRALGKARRALRLKGWLKLDNPELQKLFPVPLSAYSEREIDRLIGFTL